MATATFDKKEAAVNPEIAAQMDDNSETALVPRGLSALGQVSGELTTKDIPVPRLNIAYGVGGLASKFNPGDMVLDGEHFLVKKGDPLEIIILQADFYWKEYLSREAREAGTMPKVFKTEKEVIDNGGTVAWSDDGVGPTFSKAVVFTILIKKPEGITCSLFAQKMGGVEWSLARWNVDKSAYKRRGNRGVGPVFLQALATALKDRGMLSGKWSVTTGVELINGNNTVVPTIRLTGVSSQAEVEELQKLLVG